MKAPCLLRCPKPYRLILLAKEATGVGGCGPWSSEAKA